MIISQIEDFLNQSKISIEDIQVIRKLSSITLQVDEQPINDSTAATIIHAIEQHEDNDSFIDEDYEELISETDQEDEEIKIKSQIDEAIVVSDYLPCLKCGEVMTSKRSSELHYFLKHSMLGIQIENEVEQSEEVFVGNDGKPTFIKKCRSCGSDFQDSSSLRYHLLVTHCDEVLLNIYELLAIDTTSKKLEIANNYLDYIKDLMQTSDGDLVVDENVKSYFYQFYSCDATDNAEPFTCTSEDRVFNVIDHEVQVNPSEKAKPEKNSIDLNVEGRAWIRREINLRKKTIQTEKGTQVVYRCAYCNSHSSNSAPGFRYHLLSKHLKNKNFQDLHEIRSDLETQQPKKTDSLKNICIECNLKLKDSKTLKTHRDSHELFETVAEHYFFPSCNTCSKIFIDDSTLKLHLANHNIRDNVEDPIAVPLGSLIMQGKQIDYIEISHYPEADDDNFWWSCGHCSRKFQQEFSCRDHLLKFHVSSFTCPIDKRIFSGNKSVSLFSHHLRNKHPELFPNVTFSCTFCKMSFSSIYEKLSHMKNCDLKKFFCDHCGKRFFKKGELVSHLRFVSGELYFACKECYKKFENLSDLKIHLRSHTKEVSILIASSNALY